MRLHHHSFPKLSNILHTKHKFFKLVFLKICLELVKRKENSISSNFFLKANKNMTSSSLSDNNSIFPFLYNVMRSHKIIIRIPQQIIYFSTEESPFSQYFNNFLMWWYFNSDYLFLIRLVGILFLFLDAKIFKYSESRFKGYYLHSLKENRSYICILVQKLKTNLFQINT